MALYGRSCELSGITHNGTGLESTTAGRFSGTYGIRSSTFPNSVTGTDWIGITAGNLDGGPYTGTFYHRGFTFNGGTTTGKIWLEYSNNSGTPVFRIISTSANNFQAQYWNGSTFVAIGSIFSVPASVLYKHDLKIICGASFEFSLTNNMSLEPALVASGSAAMTAVTNLAGIKGYAVAGTQALQHSEWIWGDEPTTGHRLALAPPTGNGTYTAGSGAFGDVDEAVTNDADFSTLAANGDAETYTHGAMTLPAGTVKQVFIEARVRNVAGGAQNVKARLRIGSTDYDASINFAGIGATFGPYVYNWASNPAGGAWSPTTAGQTSNEFGLLGQT